MDYNSLIAFLRNKNIAKTSDDIETAAAAIETLLAERNAAINEIEKVCRTCMNWGKSKETSPCKECWTQTGPQKNWKWGGLHA